MKVKSTGLGKTTLTASFTKIAPDGEPHSMLMAIESTAPVHWNISVVMGGADVRQVLPMVLRPSVLWTFFLMLLRGNKI
ncbi:MAG: hypothetical protein ACYC6T_17970 [Thermoleophilia bacterium]